MYKYFKRFFDVLFALILLIFLSPFLLLSMLIILIETGSPVLFIQKRIGKNSKPFKIYKLRTLKIKNSLNETDSERLSRFGTLLRKTSFDEIPQLVNILAGEMSFIGPRPLLEEYLPYYTEREKKRHDVRPGLSCLAQINGRSNLSWEQQFEYDAQYVETLSFKIDLMIFFKTIPRVLFSSNMMVTGRIDKYKFDISRTQQVHNTFQ